MLQLRAGQKIFVILWVMRRALLVVLLSRPWSSISGGSFCSVRLELLFPLSGTSESPPSESELSELSSPGSGSDSSVSVSESDVVPFLPPDPDPNPVLVLIPGPGPVSVSNTGLHARSSLASLVRPLAWP